MFVLPELSAPPSVNVDTQPVTYLSRHLGTGRFFTLGPLQPNYGAYYGISSLNVNDIPVPSNFSRYVHQRLDPYADPTVLVGTGRSPFVPSPAQELTRDLAGYQAAGVHVLTPHGQTLNLGAGAPRPVSITPTTFIYRLAGAAPLFTASGCGVSSSRTAVATVVCSHPSELIRRETSMKGWSASVNGRSTPIHTVAGLFQAIRLPAGHDRVTFSFSPPYIVWAWLAFLIGGVWFLVTVGFAAAAWREQLNPPGVSTSAHGVREAQE